MHFTQQSALAVIVFTSSALTAPIDIEARSKDLVFRSIIDEINAEADSLTARGETGIDWKEFTSRSIVDEVNDEANALIARGLDNDDDLVEVTARSIVDEVNAEANSLIARGETGIDWEVLNSRSIVDEVNDEANSLIARGETGIDWKELISRSIVDEVNDEANALIARGLEDNENFWQITARSIEELETREPRLFGGGKKDKDQKTDPKDPNAPSTIDKLADGAEKASGITGALSSVVETAKGWWHDLTGSGQ